MRGSMCRRSSMLSRRAVHHAQRRQSRAALRAGGQISRHERRGRICRDGAQGAASHRARAFALRRASTPIGAACATRFPSTASSAAGSLCSTISSRSRATSSPMATRWPSSSRRCAHRSPISARFPSSRSGQEGLLALHGLHFDLGSGQLLSLEQETGRFAALAEASISRNKQVPALQSRVALLRGFSVW